MQLIKKITILCLGLLLAACEKSPEASPDSAAVISESTRENTAASAIGPSKATALPVALQQKLQQIILNPMTPHEDLLHAKAYLLDATAASSPEIEQFIAAQDEHKKAEVLLTARKISFLKQLYAQYVNDDLMAVDLIKLYAAPNMQQLIEKRDAIAAQYPGEMCDWVRSILIPGSGDYDLKLSDIQYLPLANGKIGVEAVNFGEKFRIDFDVDCQGEQCKIRDLFTPESYLNELKEIVKNQQC